MKPLDKAQIREANSALVAILSDAREALGGRKAFSFEALRSIVAPLQQMAPIVSHATEQGATGFALAPELKEYADNLSALQITLEKIQFMLLARQTSLQASRSHAETLNLWATRLKETR